MRVTKSANTAKHAVLALAVTLAGIGQALAGSFANIPASDLQTALDRFVAYFGVQLVYRSDDIKGLSSQAVSGEISATEALQQLLLGTSLEAKADGTGAFAVFPRRTNTGSEQNISDDSAYQVLVTGVSRHLAEINSTGTRSDVSPMALPQSVSTIERDLLQRQGITTLADAVSNVAGVANPGTSGSLSIRGFSAGVLKNGILDPAQDTMGFTVPTIALERIEVIKGPEAIIAGQRAGYGGVVNVITKGPQTKRSRELELYADNTGRREIGADFGGSLGGDGQLYGRLILSAMGETTDQLGFDGGKRHYVAPALGFTSKSSGTKVVLSFERNEQSNKNWWQVFYDEARQTLSDSLHPVRLGDNRRVITDGVEETLSLSVSQQLTDRWRLGMRVLRTTTNLGYPGARVGLIVPGAYPQVFGIDVNARIHDEKRTVRMDVRGEALTGPVTHKVLVAYDLDTRELLRSTALAQGVFDVRTGGELSAISSTPWMIERNVSPRETGWLLMDHATLGPWVGMLGMRGVTYNPNEKLSGNGVPFQTTLPAIGVLYQWSPDYSVYLSRSRAATPNTGAIDIATGREVEPNRAVQNEVGFKARHPIADLAISAAVFQIDETSRAIADPRNYGYSISVSGVSSRGLDIEVSGMFLDHWDARLAYAYLDIAQLPGQDVIQYARHQYSLGLAYRLDGDGAGWSIGGRLIGRSSAPSGERTISGGQIVSSPSVRCDVSAVYAAKHWSLAIGVKNLADRMNYTLNSGIGGSGFLEQVRQGYLSLNYVY